jgi:hypothetical protein
MFTILCANCFEPVSVFAKVCPFCRCNPDGGPNPYEGDRREQYERITPQTQQARPRPYMAFDFSCPNCATVNRIDNSADWACSHCGSKLTPLTWCSTKEGFWFPIQGNAWVQGCEWKASENPSIYHLYQGTNLMGAWDWTTDKYWDLEGRSWYSHGQWAEKRLPWWREVEAERAEQAAQAAHWLKAEDGFWYPVRNKKYLPGYQWKQSDNPQIYYLYKYDALKGAWHPSSGKYWKQKAVMEYAQDGQLLIVPVTKWMEARPPWWQEATQAEAAQTVPAEDIQITE